MERDGARPGPDFRIRSASFRSMGRGLRRPRMARRPRGRAPVEEASSTMGTSPETRSGGTGRKAAKRSGPEGPFYRRRAPRARHRRPVVGPSTASTLKPPSSSTPAERAPCSIPTPSTFPTRSRTLRSETPTPRGEGGLISARARSIGPHERAPPDRDPPSLPQPPRFPTVDGAINRARRALAASSPTSGPLLVRRARIAVLDAELTEQEPSASSRDRCRGLDGAGTPETLDPPPGRLSRDPRPHRAGLLRFPSASSSHATGTGNPGRPAGALATAMTAQDGAALPTRVPNARTGGMTSSVPRPEPTLVGEPPSLVPSRRSRLGGRASRRDPSGHTSSPTCASHPSASGGSTRLDGPRPRRRGKRSRPAPAASESMEGRLPPGGAVREAPRHEMPLPDGERTSRALAPVTTTPSLPRAAGGPERPPPAAPVLLPPLPSLLPPLPSLPDSSCERSLQPRATSREHPSRHGRAERSFHARWSTSTARVDERPKTPPSPCRPSPRSQPKVRRRECLGSGLDGGCRDARGRPAMTLRPRRLVQSLPYWSVVPLETDSRGGPHSGRRSRSPSALVEDSCPR